MRKRNTGCVYTGKVGARMTVRVKRPSRRVLHTSIKLIGGPLNGATIALDKMGDKNTLPITIYGQVGHYTYGKWVPA